MPTKELTASIKSHILSMGFDDVGIASVDGELPFANNLKNASKEGRLGPLDYLYKTVEQRSDLRLLYPDARSVIVVIKNYYTGDFPDEALGKAKIARYAWGKDYHQWFKKRLRKIALYLTTSHAPCRAWIFNDTSPVLERSWAFKAGLGFIGKSSMFISRKYGTWTLIGGLITDISLSFDKIYDGPDCGSCTRCMDACPTQAIKFQRVVDARRCISTWTIERPLHSLALKEAPRDHGWGFGCDICQEVCPWNKYQVVTNEERFLPLLGRLYLSRETFKQDLFGSPLNRARKAGLLANYLRTRKTLYEPNIKNILI